MSENLSIKSMTQRKRKTGQILKDLTWRGNGTTKYATWNVRGLNGKEQELVEEVSAANIPLVGITETKRKGSGCEQLSEGYMLFYSGVSVGERAKGGVACLVQKEYVKNVKEWEFISERLMKIIWLDGFGAKIAVIIAYAPNENDLAEEKEAFYEALQKLVDETKEFIILLEDLNGRVGNDTFGYKGVLGIHGESVRNDNGKRLLQFCQANSMVILNSMFLHKEIHKYTREEPARDEKSIIDYIIVRKEELSRVRNVRVKRGPEIG